ncbi:unnamed protein product [Ambrosiozyma monospora]|uniref:Unnamed protein product n=1 Tax=Ambrosiozyma monospora TaxID=43982 RepID=A0A9W6YU52_AMBMO|nr:unnamed protein product [Ambrosiozyma monospora]
MKQGNLDSLASISQHWNLHSLVISSPMGVVDLRDVNLSGLRLLIIKMEFEALQINLGQLSSDLHVFDVVYSSQPYSDPFRLCVPCVTPKIQQLALGLGMEVAVYGSGSG